MPFACNNIPLINLNSIFVIYPCGLHQDTACNISLVSIWKPDFLIFEINFYHLVHSSYTSESEFYCSHLYLSIEDKKFIGSSWIARYIIKRSAKSVYGSGLKISDSYKRFFAHCISILSISTNHWINQNFLLITQE